MRMKYYIQSVDYQCWERIESGDYTTTSDRDQWTSANKAEFRKNALTITILHCGLSCGIFIGYFAGLPLSDLEVGSLLRTP